MSKTWKIILIVLGALLVLVVLIQLVPFGRDHNNPAVAAEPAWDSPRTRELFMRACGDCHSNETVWPWYTNVAPVSWFIANHVYEGRSRFNVSDWGRGENEGEEAANSVNSGWMPPNSFLLMHPEARLTAAEKQELINGLLATFGGELGGEGRRGGDD